MSQKLPLVFYISHQTSTLSSCTICTVLYHFYSPTIHQHGAIYCSPAKMILKINPFMPSGLFYLNSLDQSISKRRCVWLVFIFTMFFVEIPVINANSVYPDQMPLRCLIKSYTVCKYLFYGKQGMNGFKGQG